ncbi:MAG TPA: TetR/AcrR family transcriptional regulator [Smithellaceae bacterium]|nr:TetR/AcrR family transcriptional regulator [Smithellaceae bacterium]HRV43707.1 TetR/AcrR family transcriptional regulator [Smithellaceae bacterium]
MNKTDKRADIIDVALNLIAQRGFHDSPMALIAQEAGVAAGTIYRYFESKDDLILTLNRELENRIHEMILEEYPADGSIREKFLYINRKVLTYFMDHPLHFRFMEQFFNSPYGISHRKEKLLGKSDSNSIMIDIFQKGIEEQIPKNLPMPAMYALAFGPLITLLRDYILGFLRLDDEAIEQFTQACWDAVKK